MHPDIDLVTLRVLLAAADRGSISAAGEQLQLAVAAASARITAFEESVGFRVFERTTRGVHLTPAGHQLVQRSRSLVLDADRLALDLRDYARGVQGHVRILANASSLLEVLPQMIESFAKTHPLIQVNLEERGSPEIPLALLEGRADVGVLDLPLAPPGIAFTDFFSDTLVLLVSSEHRFAHKQRLHLFEALDEDFIALADATALSGRLVASAAADGRTLRVRMRMRSFDAVSRMVAAGLGVAILPVEAIGPQLAELPIKAIALGDSWARRTHRIAVRTDLPLSPAAQSLLTFLVPGSCQNMGQRRKTTTR